MAKEKTKSLLDKAVNHKVKRQVNKVVSPEQLQVYVAWINGEIETSQACFALDLPVATFRGNAGTTLRDAIASQKLSEIEYLD